MGLTALKKMIGKGGLVGLIAGNGPLPVEFAREAASQGIGVVAVAHEGETLAELNDWVRDITWVKVGEVGALLEAFKSKGVTKALMLGGIDKRKALQHFRPDERALRLLEGLKARGDDAILGALASELESEGIEVVSSAAVLAEWLCPEGALLERGLSPREEADLELGIKALLKMGELDIGQTVVVKEGVILAIEAVEGTDEAIRRGGYLGGEGAVVVKGSKPGQDLRFDIPVVGPRTVKTMIGTGARVLALEAHKTLLLDRTRTLNLAEVGEISVVGWKRGD